MLMQRHPYTQTHPQAQTQKSLPHDAFASVYAANQAMQQLIKHELASHEAEKLAVKQLHIESLWSAAERRQKFYEEMNQADRKIRLAWAEDLQKVGLQGFDLDAVRRCFPQEGEALAKEIEATRALATQIERKDKEFIELIQRIQACIGGYLSAVSPRAGEYNRHGAMQRYQSAELTSTRNISA